MINEILRGTLGMIIFFMGTKQFLGNSIKNALKIRTIGKKLDKVRQHETHNLF